MISNARFITLAEPVVIRPVLPLTFLLLALISASGHATDPMPMPPGTENAAPAAPISAVENALFVVDHLKTLPARGGNLTYKFAKTGAYEAGYEDRVSLEVGTVDPKMDNGRTAKMEFLSGDHKTELPPIEGAKGNPVIMGFLERDVREMKRITGGQPYYYRKRLRLAMVEAKEIKPINIHWNGHDVHAQEIIIDPYKDDPARARFARFANKTYAFVLSDQVPGGVYSIKSVMHEGNLTGKTMIEETLTLSESK